MTITHDSILAKVTMAALRECLTYLQNEWPSLTAQNNLPDMALTPCVAIVLAAQARADCNGLS